MMWQDEAQTALVSRTLLTHWVPMGHDDKNSFSQELGAEYDRDGVYKWHPWFPFYLLSGFFALFGTSTFIARLPFALCGIGTVIAVYFLALALWQGRRAAVMAALMLTLSVPFLLLSRQCRYYAPEALFTVLALHAYLCLLQRKRYAPTYYAVSAILLFHTSVLQYMVIIASVGVHCIICRRDRIIPLLLASLVTVVFTAPWLIWTSNIERVARVAARKHFPNQRPAILEISTMLRMSLFPWYLLVVAAGVGVWARHKRIRLMDRWTLQGILLLLIVSAVLIISLLYMSSAGIFFRYLCPLIPLSCCLIALIAERLARLTHLAAGVALILLVAYTIGPVLDFGYELTHRYEGPIDGIVRFLNSSGKPGDLVVITYEDLPLKFYTKMRVLGGLTGEDLSPAANAQWIIIRRHPLGPSDMAVGKYIALHVDRNRYERIELDSPDTEYQNRETPWAHKFRTDTTADHVMIFHRFR